MAGAVRERGSRGSSCSHRFLTIEFLAEPSEPKPGAASYGVLRSWSKRTLTNRPNSNASITACCFGMQRSRMFPGGTLLSLLCRATDKIYGRANQFWPAPPVSMPTAFLSQSGWRALSSLSTRRS